MLGDAQHQYNWDGSTYRFASTKHLELFKADPDRYLPQYINLCAASVAKGVKVQVSRNTGWCTMAGFIYSEDHKVLPSLMRGDASMKSVADKNFSAMSRLPNPPQ